MKSGRAGFTLIEMMVVISIIALLSSTVMATLSVTREKSVGSKTISNSLEVEKALELYFAQNGHYPLSPLNNVYGLSCWECNTSVYYDPNRLSALAPYQPKRPCDHFATVNPDGSCSNPNNWGFHYKVDPVGRDYKLAVTYYGPNYFGTPAEKFVDWCFLSWGPCTPLSEINTISIASSPRSKTWSVLCRFDGAGVTCQ
jgi:prepilin-type N-terminal cleavage/methylation domain-containing protein